MRFLLPAFLLLAAASPPQDPDATERMLRVAERRYRETPDPTDPRGAAARLGFDRTKIAGFVAGLAWEPYGGILREAAGTLMCGGGNSIDRALLLQAMLEAGGEKTRLMRVDVAEADGARLLESFRKRERKERPLSDPKALADELGVDPAVLEQVVQTRRNEEAALVEEVVEAAKAEAARLLPLAGAIAGRAAAVPREHVFVQVQEKAGWVDLDPSPVELPHATARPLTPQEIAAQRRSIAFRLILNRKSGAKTEPVPLLSVPLDLSAASWKVVEFLIQPLQGQLPASADLKKLDARGVVAAFLKVKQYRAVLIVDGKSYGGVPFDLDGKTYDVDPGGRVGPAKALSGGLGKAFGGAFGGGDEAPAASALESVVVEVGVKEGGVERVQRRTLVTTPQPGSLRALPFLRHSYLVDAAPLPQGELGRRELHGIVANAAAIRRMVKGPLAGIHFNPQVDITPTLLLYGDLRRRALDRLAEGSVYIQDRVGLVAETSQIFVDEAAGRMLARQGIDILDNPGFFDGAADRTVTLGAAETVLECLLVGRFYASDARRSAWTLMERARLQGGKAEAVDREGRREVRWSADAWWSIDPAGGMCVGRVPSGAGQGLIETLIESASQVCQYADAVGFVSGASGATGQQPGWADKTTKTFGRACGALAGTNVRDELKDQIDEMTKNAWATAISSMMGL
ncbi:MAG TPA: hypothetical protein VE981_07215 [Planctomycetota bacterium]|nr:hypothetical protein [Planctomycetota bacterium]